MVLKLVLELILLSETMCCISGRRESSGENVFQVTKNHSNRNHSRKIRTSSEDEDEDEDKFIH